MKKLLIVFASLSLLALTASAYDHCGTRSRIVGYSSCGTPIVATLEVVGYSRCGDPIFNWITHYPRETSYGHHSSRCNTHHSSRYSSHHRR